MFQHSPEGGFAACKPPVTSYPAAMERPPREHPPRDLEAEAAALARPEMFDCERAPNAMRISERQCLINQARAAAQGFPSYCRDCPQGAAITARHPEGVQLVSRRQANGGDHSLVLEGAQAFQPAPPALSTTPEKPEQLAGVSPPPAAAKAPKRAAVAPTLPHKPIDSSVDQSIDQPKAPRCEKHGVEKAADKLGRYRCEKCRAENYWQQRAAEEQKERRGRRDQAAIRYCPQHPEQEQRRNRVGVWMGRCSLCLRETFRNARLAKKQKEKDVKKVIAEKEISSCPQHPEEKQLADATGQALGFCSKCLAEGVGRGGRLEIPGWAAAASSKNGSGPGLRELLQKLPDFDAAWPEAVQIKWLEAFQAVISPERGAQAGKPAPLCKQASKQARTLRLITSGERP